MERALRRKFVTICVIAVTLVMVVIATVINLLNYQQMTQSVYQTADILAQSKGVTLSSSLMFGTNSPPNTLSAEAPYMTRFFTVVVDETGQVIGSDLDNVVSVTAEQAEQVALALWQDDATQGTYQTFKYKAYQTQQESLYVFVDFSQELTLARTFLIISIGICLVALIAVSVLVLLFSKRAVSPIVQSYQKQKQFINDMSHEIKTPLAIIKANTEVIDLENGSSEWSESIHVQVGKLSQLVGSLLSLTRIEQSPQERLHCDFSLTDAVVETAESFAVLAQVQLQVQKHLTYCGEEQSIRQLISILIENAIKYRVDDTPIAVSLFEKRGHVVLRVINQARGLEPGHYGQWFERFYRAEHSRNSQTGGFGIGLATAKAIVKRHGGKIVAQSKDGKTVELCVTLS